MMKRWKSACGILVLALAVCTVLLVRRGKAADPNWARVRLVHAVPGGPVVDVFVDGEEVASDVSYKTVTPYESLSVGSHTIQVKLNFPPITLISETVVLTTGLDATVIGVGQDTDIEALYLQDNNSPSNTGTVRFVHLSPDTSVIDIAVRGTPVFTIAGDIPYMGASDYVGGLGAGLMSFEVRPAGQITPLLTFSRTLDQDTINTLFIMGLTTPPESMSYPLEVVHSVDRRFFWIFLPTSLKNS